MWIIKSCWSQNSLAVSRSSSQCSPAPLSSNAVALRTCWHLCQLWTSPEISVPTFCSLGCELQVRKVSPRALTLAWQMIFISVIQKSETKAGVWMAAFLEPKSPSVCRDPQQTYSVGKVLPGKQGHKAARAPLAACHVCHQWLKLGWHDWVHRFSLGLSRRPSPDLYTLSQKAPLQS